MVRRNAANCNAAIRYCDKCKDSFNYIRQAERMTTRAIGNRPGKSRRTYLARN